MSGVVAIVPAAGLSRRFGGPNKLLQTFDDTTVVGAVVRTLRACNLDVLVVTGRDADLVQAAVAPAPSVFNPEYERGLGTSIACGVREAVRYGATGFLIALGDMPQLRAEVVRQLLAEAEEHRIVVPVYADDPERPGHPVIFGSAYGTELSALTGDTGAKAIVEAHQDRLIRVAVEGSLPDVDV